MSETHRQQTVVERILEDESLRGELEDPAATALINWATERAGKFAADPAHSDAEVDATTLAIRTAARQAAGSGEQEPERVVALAEAALAEQSPDQAVAIAETAPPHSPAAPTAAESPSEGEGSVSPAGAPDQNDATAPARPAERAVGATTKAPASKRRSKRRQRSRRKSR
jgi:hypothetical protein